MVDSITLLLVTTKNIIRLLRNYARLFEFNHIFKNRATGKFNGLTWC
jgi:hypothetical protein